MGNDNNAVALFMGKGAEYLNNVDGVGRVEITRRFVGKNGLCARCQRAGDSNSLLLAAGEVSGETVMLLFTYAHAFQQGLGAFLGLLGMHAAKLHGIADVFKNGHQREEVESLKDHGDRLSAVAVKVKTAQALILEAHLARSGQVETRQHGQHGGLTAAGGADNGIELSFFEFTACRFYRSGLCVAIFIGNIIQNQI